MAGAAPGEVWVVDLDGVVWLADQPIEGAAHAVERLRASGARVLFATNNASPTVEQFIDRLAKAAIEVQSDDLVTSALAAASMLDPGSTAVICADAGVSEALMHRGVQVVAEGPADSVVVGWTRFDFDRVATAAAAVRAGARLIGTNEDATYPTPQGLLPGAGAVLAAVATASQTTPEVAGKPHAPLASLIHQRVGKVSFVVGDRPSTDGALANRLQAKFALVRSGVTKSGKEPMTVHPDIDAPDFATLVDRVLGLP